MNKKICRKCQDSKLLENFPKDRTKSDGYDCYCKLCKREKIKKFYEDPIKLIHHRKTIRKWNDDPKNYKKRCSYHIKYIKKRHKNPSKKLAHHLGTQIYIVLSKLGKIKSKKSLNIIGLSNWKEFIKYIESTWIEGMNWENYGVGKNNSTWHIDHKIPISKAKNVEEVEKLFHYTNLRAMWGSDNIRKSNNLIY